MADAPEVHNLSAHILGPRDIEGRGQDAGQTPYPSDCKSGVLGQMAWDPRAI